MGSKVDVLTTVVSKALVSYLLKVLELVPICGLSFSACISLSLSSVCDSFFFFKELCALLTHPRGLLVCRPFLLEASSVRFLGTKASWKYHIN